MKLFGRLLLLFLAANAITAAVALLMGGWYVKLLYSQSDAQRDGEAAVAIYEREGGEALRRWVFQQRVQNGVMGMLRGAEGMPLDLPRPNRMFRGEGGDVVGFAAGPGVPEGPVTAGPGPGAFTAAAPVLTEALPPPGAGAMRMQIRGDAGPGFAVFNAEPGGVFELPVRKAEITGGAGRHYVWHGSRPPPQGYTALLADAALRVLVSLLVVGAAAWLAARRIARPVAELEQVSMRLAGGDLGARVQRSVTGREDELGSLGSAFNDMAERVSRLVESHRRLLRDVSHELRTPLARARIAAELARERGEARHFDRIEQELEQLAGLIQQVLLLARLDDPHAGTAQGGARFALAALLEDVCAQARIEAQRVHVELACEFAADAGAAQVAGSAAALRSAFENILRNALRFSPEDGTVAIKLAREGSSLRAEVCDGGPGVPDEALGLIFQAFVRVSGARERRSGSDDGAGLGLTIAEAAVRAHGGTIRARNREGGGLCVEVELPTA